MQEVEPKNKGGRPLKFKTVEELESRIRDYFSACDPHTEMRRVESGTDQQGRTIFADREVMTEQKPYTISGLAIALDTNRETLLDYESGKHDEKAGDFEGADRRFSDAVKAAKVRVQSDVEERLLSGMPSTGMIFWLKNNAGWRDRQEVDHTTKDQPMPLLQGLAPAKLEVEDDGSPAQADDSSN